MTKVIIFSESPLTIKKKLIIFKLFGIMDFDGKIRAALEVMMILQCMFWQPNWERYFADFRSGMSPDKYCHAAR